MTNKKQLKPAFFAGFVVGLLFIVGCNFKVYKGLTPSARIVPPVVSAYDAFREHRIAEKNPQFIVGAAVVDITPKRSRSVWMAGYMPNKRTSGTDTPISARILYLDDGEHALTIVSLDFVGFLRPDIEDIRTLVSRSFKDEIVVLSTHNHAGPDVMGLWGRALFYMIPVESGRDEGYILRVKQLVARGILQAQASAKPAHLIVAQTEGPKGYCDNWRIPGFWDKTATALMAVDIQGRPIATLVNWTCHAEFLGEGNTQLSADFPYYFYKRLEARTGGVAIFANGALGGIVVPIIGFERKSMPVRFRKRIAESCGYELADLVLNALVSDGVAIANPRIEHRNVLLDLPVDNWRFRRLMNTPILKRKLYTYDNGVFLRTEAHAIRIGPLAIATVPGEIFPSIGFPLKKRLMTGAKFKMVFGLTGDELGYIMLPPEFEMDKYSYEQSVSLGPHTGEILWEALRLLWDHRNEPLPEAPTPPE